MNEEDLQKRLDWAEALTLDVIEMMGDELDVFDPYGGMGALRDWSEYIIFHGAAAGQGIDRMVLAGIAAGITLEKRRVKELDEIAALVANAPESPESPDSPDESA